MVTLPPQVSRDVVAFPPIEPLPEYVDCVECRPVTIAVAVAAQREYWIVRVTQP